MLFLMYQISKSPTYWVVSTEDKKYVYSGPFLDTIKAQIMSRFLDKGVEFIMIQEDVGIGDLEYSQQ